MPNGLYLLPQNFEKGITNLIFLFLQKLKSGSIFFRKLLIFRLLLKNTTPTFLDRLFNFLLSGKFSGLKKNHSFGIVDFFLFF